MNPDLLTMALIVGVFTWAFRFLPTRLDLSKLHPDGHLVRFLAATGPAAIATLLVASSWPLVSGALVDMGPLAVGVLSVVGAFSWRRSVVLATLVGALAYGVAFALA
ncbi:MAG: AzlD domain-containing protein [Pseudorhodobacter sp.]|nr:AzlD domain-containing protein [Pseudorhodobacter sp.]